MNANASGSRELVQSVLEILDQGEALLTQLSDDDYTQKVPVAFNASIGGHYRHCLDHFRSLLDSAIGGDLNYDHRERGTLIESDRFAALNATRELREAYAQFDLLWLTRPLNVTCKTSYATRDSQVSPSTVGREFMYSVAHAVHHYALIGVMCGILGSKIPTGLGMALERRLARCEGPDRGARPAAPEPESPEGDPHGLWQALGHDPTDMDQLVSRTGLTAASLSSMLLVMELQGRVSVEHGRYSRKR